MGKIFVAMDQEAYDQNVFFNYLSMQRFIKITGYIKKKAAAYVSFRYYWYRFLYPAGYPIQ